MCPGIGIYAAAAFFIQFREESKATSQHLSSIGGKYSLAKISESERKAALGKEVSNSILESVHAASTLALKTCGMIRLDNAAGEGQARFNKHFERDHEKYAKPKQNSESESPLTEGLFVTIEPELKEALIVEAKRGAQGLRKHHNDALKCQNDAGVRRKQIEYPKKCEAAKSNTFNPGITLICTTIQIGVGRMLRQHGKNFLEHQKSLR
jgi:hypothetical protein